MFSIIESFLYENKDKHQVVIMEALKSNELLINVSHFRGLKQAEKEVSSMNI